MLRRVSALAAALALGMGLAAGTADAAPTVNWMCRPGTSNPCTLPSDVTDLKTGITTPAKTPTPEDQKVDCFYVYPTVTNQVAINANPVRMPEVDSIARFQAARFNSMCRMFAPLYPQMPLTTLAVSLVTQAKPVADFAYAGVLAAWRQYLAKDNNGRGVVFIGHSQGTMMLRKLLREEIDPNPKERARVVGAFLIGGNLTVAQGSTTGGDFRNIPLCTRRGQFGCAIGYSTDTDPQIPSLLANTDLDLLSPIMGLPHGPGMEIACTDPGKLADDNAPVGVTVPSEPYSFGIISVLLDYTTFPSKTPSSKSTWTTSKARATGQCESRFGYQQYRFHQVSDAEPINKIPIIDTHLLDINLGLERLVSIASIQANAWVAR